MPYRNKEDQIRHAKLYYQRVRQKEKETGITPIFLANSRLSTPSRREYKKLWARKNRGYVAPVERNCIICAETFMPDIWHPTADVCSRRCSKRKDYTNHKDSYMKQANKWRIKNPEKFKATLKRCREKNPDLYRAISRNKQNRRRDYFPKDGDFTAKHWLQLVLAQQGDCWWCGKNSKLTIDHIVPIIKGGKHTLTNIVGSCHSCNCKKKDRLWPIESGALQGKLDLQAVWDAITDSLK